jgi:hypothetical protein
MGDAGIKIVHAIPGRIRLRIPQIREDPEYGDGVRERLLALPGIRTVAVSPPSASVVVTYDDATSLPALVPGVSEVLQAVVLPGTERREIESMLRGSPNGSTPSSKSLADQIVGFFGTVDAGVGQVTAGSVDLRILLPLSLFALGLGRLITQSSTPVPTWFDFIWFSFGTFMALNVTAGSAGQAP